MLAAGAALGPSGCERGVDLPAELAWPALPRPTYTGQPRLALTNNGDDTLAMVSLDDLSKPRLLDRVPVGKSPIELEGPHHLIASPDGAFIYFNLSNYVVGAGGGPHGSHGTGTVPGSVIKIDVRTNRKVGSVLVDRSPGDLILSRDGTLAFVSHYDLARWTDQQIKGRPAIDGYSKIAIVDTRTMALLSLTPVCPATHGQGLSPDETELYVTCASDEVAVLDVRDPRAPKVQATVRVGPMPGQSVYEPYALTVYNHPTTPAGTADRDHGTVWVSDLKSRDVRVFDPRTRQMDGRAVSVAGAAMFSAFSADHHTLYVPVQGASDPTPDTGCNGDCVFAVSIPADGQPLTRKRLQLGAGTCLNAHALHTLGGVSGIADGSRAALVCEGDHQSRLGTLAFLDLTSGAPGVSLLGSVETGVFPDGVTYLPPLPASP